MLSCINVIAISRCDFPASTTSSILARRRRGIIEFPPNGTSNSVPNSLRVPIALLLSCKYLRIPTNPRIELSWNNSQYLMEQNLFAFCTFNKQFIRSRCDPLVWLSCRSVGRPGWPWQYCTPPPAYLSCSDSVQWQTNGKEEEFILESHYCSSLLTPQECTPTQW